MKKIAKILGLVAGAMLVLAATGCNNDTPVIGSIQLADPVVTAESRFGANVLSWAPIDNAEGYLVYRQKVTVTTNDKGKEVKEYSDMKYIDEVKQSDKSVKILYKDAISISNILKEGETYCYTVEAVNTNGKVDSRAVLKEDDIYDFARGKGSAEVTIAEGNMPAWGTKVAAPTTSEVIVSKKDGAVLIQGTQDVLSDDGVTIGTGMYVTSTGKGKWEGDANDDWGTREPSYGWSAFYHNWSNDTVIELPGLYDVYQYNSPNNTYYESSDFVLKAEKVEVPEVASAKYKNVEQLSLNVDNGSVIVEFAVNKELYAAKPTYELVKYVATVGTAADCNDIGNRIAIKSVCDTKFDFKDALLGIDVDGNAYFELIDSDVEELEDDEFYLYMLKVSTDDWYGKTVNSITYTVSESELAATFVLNEGATVDKETGDVTYTGDADLIAYGSLTVPTGSKLTATKAKYSKMTGLSEETAITLTTVLKYTEAEKDYVSYTFTDAKLAKLNSEEYEAYVYKVTVTTPEGAVAAVYTKTYSDWNETTRLEKSISLRYVNADIETTKSSIKIPVVLTKEKDADENVKVRAYVTYSKDTDNKYGHFDNFAVVDTDNLKYNKEDKEYTGTVSITELPKDTFVSVTLYVVNADNEKVSNTVYVYTATDEE